MVVAYRGSIRGQWRIGMKMKRTMTEIEDSYFYLETRVQFSITRRSCVNARNFEGIEASLILTVPSTGIG